MSTKVQLSAIAFDAGTQIREAIDQHVVGEYAEAMTGGAQFPPIVLFHDGSQHYLADGFHRFMAAQRNTLTDIDADVRPGTKEDAVWFALGANKHHGKQLSSADKKHAILVAISTWPTRSNRELAAQIGCSDVYISQVKKSVQTTSHLSGRVTGRDGKSYPASHPQPKRGEMSAQRQAVTAMVLDGARSTEIQKALGAHSTLIADVKRELGQGGLDKSRAAIDARRDRMREMAAEGHTSRQMAAELGISEDGCRNTLKKEGIAVPADKATRFTHRHDPNRIVDGIVMDAENLTEGVRLIDFDGLDRSRLADWLGSLTASRDKLGSFIRRLMKEQQQHGEAADTQAVQDSTGAHRSDAHSTGARHAARVS